MREIGEREPGGGGGEEGFAGGGGEQKNQGNLRGDRRWRIDGDDDGEVHGGAVRQGRKMTGGWRIDGEGEEDDRNGENRGGSWRGLDADEGGWWGESGRSRQRGRW